MAMRKFLPQRVPVKEGEDDDEEDEDEEDVSNDKVEEERVEEFLSDEEDEHLACGENEYFCENESLRDEADGWDDDQDDLLNTSFVDENAIVSPSNNYSFDEIEVCRAQNISKVPCGKYAKLKNQPIEVNKFPPLPSSTYTVNNRPYDIRRLLENFPMLKVIEVLNEDKYVQIIKIFSKKEMKETDVLILRQDLKVNKHNKFVCEVTDYEETCNEIAVVTIPYPKKCLVADDLHCMGKIIGKGGTAEVFLVYDSSNVHRAMKVMCKKLLKEAEREGCRKEIEIMCEHREASGMIKIFNHDETRNLFRIVMEYGESNLASYIKSCLKKVRCVEEGLVQGLTRRMLSALHSLHNTGIIHYDIKPENFVFVNGTVKLIDFGISLTVDKHVNQNVWCKTMGTPGYMSPETISKSGDLVLINKKTDVWSFGCIVYLMLYGKALFHGSNVQETMLQIFSTDVPIEYPDTISPLAIDFLQKCLVRDQIHRWDAEQLLHHPFVSGSEHICSTPSSFPLHKQTLRCKRERINAVSEIENSVRKPLSTIIVPAHLMPSVSLELAS